MGGPPTELRQGGFQGRTRRELRVPLQGYPRLPAASIGRLPGGTVAPCHLALVTSSPSRQNLSVDLLVTVYGQCSVAGLEPLIVPGQVDGASSVAWSV